MSLPAPASLRPVLAAVKARPCGRPAAGLDSGCGPASDISGGNGPREDSQDHKISNQGKPSLYQTRGGAICQSIPGAGIDTAIGELLISTLTPLAVEAALTVTAELENRASQADALRAAHVERARYHADLTRRRYLAVDPANRLVADTLEADWNTALRHLHDTQDACDKAREQHPGQCTPAPTPGPHQGIPLRTRPPAKTPQATEPTRRGAV